ncbi:MAG: SEL1-like repeat protein, partial [Treponema sp.]|nr:SEL1-like repeat protein [Treponema sp.]
MNENEKFDELSKKAEQGDAKAQVELGKMYYLGKGIEQDYSKSVKLWTKAAELGDSN